MKKRIFAVLFALCFLFTLVSCGPDPFYTDLPSYDGGSDRTEQTTAHDGDSNSTEQTTAHEGVGGAPLDSDFEIHFIDVGQADAALVISGGKTMIIDGGNAEDSNLIYSYLKKQGITHLDYVVCTHAHEDHVGGLSGALTAATAGQVLAPVTDYNSKAFRNFVAKAADRGCAVKVPEAGDRFLLGEAEVTVVGPLKTYDDPNNTSIILRIVYGSTSFLFTGDMESDAERDLLDAGVTLNSTVLKVGHHGSDTSTSYRFLREVAPTFGVISVGTDNQYGHPHDIVLSRLRDADVTLYRTDLQGDVICRSNGVKVSFNTAKNNGTVTNPTESDRPESDTAVVTEYAYIGNVNSQIFHTPECSSLPAETNRIWFTTRDEAVSAGYSPCGRCHP